MFTHLKAIEILQFSILASPLLTPVTRKKMKLITTDILDVIRTFRAAIKLQKWITAQRATASSLPVSGGLQSRALWIRDQIRFIDLMLFSQFNYILPTATGIWGLPSQVLLSAFAVLRLDI